ncbi:Crp/Fnr family transcriptional regulator [Candidatus Peribacteria bacterium]|nr:Crp/Fnr family transcriptional regulator [Candidatus Peribacteria bacterium]MBT4021188.1 Crp/Fnr family transcriptional regulator [Candidatus Peribacteria bacterium]MBT4240964.1 Crp/Fnr family transcriptional regulator [Candidatus Peribacteria bacterium]MBT4474608.1 Crp/Fnr family transcriptional regulator [Candidatus Peribacteria bacterium]
MHRPPFWYLSSVELFAGISEEEMHEMVSGVIDREYDQKSFLYTPHDRVENVFILKEGEVTLYQSVDGKKIVLDILKPGAVFGNIGFDPDSSEKHFAETTQDSYICTLPHNYFLQILKKRPDVALRAMKVLNKRLSQYEAQIRSLSALQARDRLLATIRLLNQKEDESILPPILRMPTRITHEKLGHMTGLTRETVTKELKNLQAEGFINVDKKHIRLSQNGIREVMAIS